MDDLTRLKFKENGEFNPFSGNTVVANLYPNESIIGIVETIQTAYQQLSFRHKFALTPKESIHMTVIELVCDLNRVSEYWSKDLSLDMPIDEVSDYFAEKLDTFPLLNESIQMKTRAIGDQKILLEPANPETLRRLNAIRDDVANKTGVRFPNHQNYQFHISIGYLISDLTKEEAIILENLNSHLTQLLLKELPQITIKRIDYTVFNDMSRFTPYHESQLSTE